MKQAMIFAAGLGTRLKPLTDTMPKALVPVGGEPLLRHVIRRLADAGFTRLVVNVHHFASQIVDYIEQNNRFGLDISISDESGQLLDTGGGIKQALTLFDERRPILIHNVDILSNANLAALYDTAENGWLGGALLVSQRTTQRYLMRDGERLLKGWKNIATGEMRGLSALDEAAVRDGSLELQLRAFSGIHVLSPRAYPYLKKMPSRFGIIDFYLKYCGEEAFLCCEQEGLQLLDVGKPEALERAPQFLATCQPLNSNTKQ